MIKSDFNDKAVTERNNNGDSIHQRQATSAISNAGFVLNRKAIVYLRSRQNFILAKKY